jgi:hypothetical protein
VKPWSRPIISDGGEIFLNPQLFKNLFDRVHQAGSGPQSIIPIGVNAVDSGTLGN